MYHINKIMDDIEQIKVEWWQNRVDHFPVKAQPEQSSN